MSMEAIGSHLTRNRGMLGAMRYPEYRKYWFATLASVIGFQMVTFSQLWLIRQLEKDPIWLGSVGLATGMPAIVLNLFGGVVADRLDQRRLIMATQTASATLILLLATLTLLGIVQVWHVLVIAFCNGTVQAFDQPARQAILPHLIDRKDLMNAVALNSSIWQGTRIVAPMLAGLIIAAAGTEASLYAGSAGFLSMVFLISRLKVPQIERPTHGTPLQNLLQGARFVRDNSLFSSLIGMTFFNSFFGLAYIQLMPIFAVDILHKGATAQGTLAGAGGIGALLGTAAVALMGRFAHRGWLLLGGSAIFGGFVVAFGLSHWYYVSIGLLFLAGFSQSVYMISVMSTLQARVPDQLRGRVMGIYGMTYNIMPVGGMASGLIASSLGAPFAVALGGSAVSGFAFLSGAFNRRVRRLGSEPVPAEA
ncbi:MAG: MFS transporter [Chloroflexi bacterium]|nr:MFS transporter [Chloroflexota bacterium]